MKKLRVILFLFVLIGSFSSCKEETEIDVSNSEWAEKYPFAKELIIRAEKGDFKEPDGERERLVYVYVINYDGETCFAVNNILSSSSPYLDELWDSEGNKITPINYDLVYYAKIIYPLESCEVTVDDYLDWQETQATC